MKLVVLVEGETEKGLKTLLLKRDLRRAGKKVGIEIKNLRGGPELISKLPYLVEEYRAEKNVLAVFALLDLQGLPIEFPKSCSGVKQKTAYARKEILADVATKHRAAVSIHFAVREIEAWIFADDEVLKNHIGKKAKAPGTEPEQINDTTKPSEHMRRLFKRHKGKQYIKVRDGVRMLGMVDPETVAAKCPHFKAMIKDMDATCARAKNKI